MKGWVKILHLFLRAWKLLRHQNLWPLSLFMIGKHVDSSPVPQPALHARSTASEIYLYALRRQETGQSSNETHCRPHFVTWATYIQLEMKPSTAELEFTAPAMLRGFWVIAPIWHVNHPGHGASQPPPRILTKHIFPMFSISMVKVMQSKAHAVGGSFWRACQGFIRTLQFIKQRLDKMRCWKEWHTIPWLIKAKATYSKMYKFIVEIQWICKRVVIND